MKKGMVIATALLAVLVAPPFGTASRTADPSLPNPCRLLASAHPQTAFGAKVLPVKHRHADHGYIGVATASCDETVGGINVFLMLSTAERGVVPVDKVLSRTALPGPSSGALFVVYLSRDHRLQTRSYGIIFHRDIPPTKTSVRPGHDHRDEPQRSAQKTRQPSLRSSLARLGRASLPPDSGTRIEKSGGSSSAVAAMKLGRVASVAESP